jgi:hypothetical protein
MKTISSPFSGLASQVLSNVLNVLVSQDVKNPYFQAMLQPLISYFSNGLVNVLPPEVVGQTAADQVQKCMPENADLLRPDASDLEMLYKGIASGKHLSKSTFSQTPQRSGLNKNSPDPFLRRSVPVSKQKNNPCVVIPLESKTPAQKSMGGQRKSK